MKIRRAEFTKSSATFKACPIPDKPEFAFIGRSNVGKSSLINLLTGRSKLAKTSSTPGKTQLINHFLINDRWYLVDLPGYGYARMPQDQRRKMMKLIQTYILRRTSLVCLFLLIDSRLEMQKADRSFLEFLGMHQVPFALVFTKTDKLTPHRLDQQLGKYKQQMLRTWTQLPSVFMTSALRKEGREDLLAFIELSMNT